MRVIRACRELGIAIGRRLLRGRPRRAARAARRRGARGRPGAVARVVPADRPRARGGARERRRRHPSRLRLPVRERGLRARLRGGRASSSSARAARRSRSWARRPRPAASAKAAACRWCRARSSRSPDAAEIAREAEAHRLPGDAQGGRRRRRQGHAARRGPRRARGRARARAAREAQGAFGDDRVYLEKAVAAPAPHRDPGAGRRARQRRAPLRARVLDPAPAPEGGRGEPVARSSRPSCASAWARWRSRSCSASAT